MNQQPRQRNFKVRIRHTGWIKCIFLNCMQTTHVPIRLSMLNTTLRQRRLLWKGHSDVDVDKSKFTHPPPNSHLALTDAKLGTQLTRPHRHNDTRPSRTSSSATSSWHCTLSKPRCGIPSRTACVFPPESTGALALAPLGTRTSHTLGRRQPSGRSSVRCRRSYERCSSRFWHYFYGEWTEIRAQHF